MPLASLCPCRRSSFRSRGSRARRGCMPLGGRDVSSRSRCSGTFSPRRVAIGTVRVVTADPDGAELARELGAEVVDDPGRRPGRRRRGRARRPRAGRDPDRERGRALRSAGRPSRAARGDAGRRDRARRGARRHDERAEHLRAADVFAPLYGRDSAARFRAHARELGLEPVSAAIPNLADDVDTIDDLRRLHLRLGPRSQTGAREAAGRGAPVKIVVLSGGVGGARFVRGVVEVADPARRDRGRQRRRRPRGARHARVARSRLDPLRARRAQRRAARLGPRRRDVERARDRQRRSAASRGSRSATATSAFTSSARRRCAPASRSPR